MTLWLTLLLVWTTGIPAALFISASVVATLHERRLNRLPGLALPRQIRPPAAGCGRRVHASGRPALGGAQPMRLRVGARHR
jgi:hypothetical protein